MVTGASAIRGSLGLLLNYPGKPRTLGLYAIGTRRAEDRRWMAEDACGGIARVESA